MTNNKQSSVEWLYSQFIQHGIIVVNQTTYGDKVTAKHEIIFKQAREMHQDEIEAAAIISSAEQSTKEASEKSEAFSIGYVQGYNRALDLLLWQIKHKLKTK